MDNNLKQLMQNHQFHIIETGGGCTAWQHVQENGDYILITDEGGMTTDIDQACIVGLYTPNGEELIIWAAENAGHALHIAQWQVIEYYAEHGQLFDFNLEITIADLPVIKKTVRAKTPEDAIDQMFDYYHSMLVEPETIIIV